MLSQLQNIANRIQPYLDWSMYVWFSDAKHNLPGNSDPIKQVVDEANIVDEGVYVTGAQHQHS